MVPSSPALRLSGLSAVSGLGGAAARVWALGRGGAPSPVVVYWALFTASASMAILHFFVAGIWGGLAAFLALGSCVTCGFGWLLSRALFRPKPTFEAWPIALVACLFAMVATVQAAQMVGLGSGSAIKIMGSLASLLSSAVLVLTMVEAVDGAARRTAGSEARFRLAFLAGYGALLAGGVILFRSGLDVPALETWKDAGQTFCAFLALGGATAAVRYRLGHPLTLETAPARRTAKDQDADPVLNRRIRLLFEEHKAFLESDLKVANLAARLGVPEYKVSLSVTRGLGFANFNQLLNHYRVEEAKRLLSDPALAKTPILTIAMDSGFGSIGPFNRAFKAQTGMTPGVFRAKRATSAMRSAAASRS